MAGYIFTLNGTVFPSATAVKSYCRDLLKRTPAGTQLSEDDFARMCDLVALHYDAQAKIGCGIRAIEVRHTPNYGSKSFYIVRRDGTSTDFSYLKCLDPQPAEHKFIAACRLAVELHIERYRTHFFRVATRPTCPLTGEPLTPENAHVDHCPPFTFKRIVSAFVQLYGVNMDDPSLCKRGDNLTMPLFADEVMRDRFVQFHNAFALLRIISASANVSLVTQSVRLKEDRILPTMDMQTR